MRCDAIIDHGGRVSWAVRFTKGHHGLCMVSARPGRIGCTPWASSKATDGLNVRYQTMCVSYRLGAQVVVIDGGYRLARVTVIPLRSMLILV